MPKTAHKTINDIRPRMRKPASMPGSTAVVPPHYDKGVQPWDLERVMESSGSVFVDARRTDAIEYCFRMKGNLLEDLVKARHCLEAAIQHLSASTRR